MDKLVHGTAADNSVRVVAAVTTSTVEDVVRRHKCSPTVAAALGRTLTGAALLAATLKDFDRLTIRVDGNGPVGGLVAEARPDGSVRGYAREPFTELPPAANGKFDVGGIVGKGTFYVIRESGFDIGLHSEPYVGSVPIQSGEIGDDLAFYLAKSEQIPAAVLLGVLLKNTEPYVAAAGGVIVEMLPGANEHIITMIEDTIAHAPQLTSVIADGSGPEELVKLVLGDIPYEILGERDVRFECTCSREKALSMISALGIDELDSMIAAGEGAVMDCGFCNEKYEFDTEGLTNARKELV